MTLKKTYHIKISFFQGVYRGTNMTVSDKHIPLAINTRGTVEFRVVGKFIGIKPSHHLFTMKAFVTVNKPFMS